jgi:hypothetical protein
MAVSLKTDSIVNLSSTTEPTNTDLFPIAANNGVTMKKLKWSDLFGTIKKKLNTVDATYNTNLTSAVDGMSITFYAKRVNGLVFGRINFETKTATLKAWANRVLCATGTIPENLQPAENQQIIVAQQSGAGTMTIMKGGEITYIPWVTMAQNNLAGAQFVYIGK